MFKKQAKKIRVLFVDEKNDTLSQLAEYFTNKLYGVDYEAYSAGPEHDLIDCDMISVMYRAGEDMRRQVSKDFKDRNFLRDDEDYDYVIYFSQSVFDAWSSRTPWKGKQMLVNLGSVKDFVATDDVELDQCYEKLIGCVSDWVKTNLEDPEKLGHLVSA